MTFEHRRDGCQICSKEMLEPALTLTAFGAEISWSRCPECGFVFQNPRLSADSIRAAYSAGNYWNSAYRDYINADRIRIANGRRRIRRIIKASNIHGGRLLDIGSATGSFGVAARDAGFAVTCVEPSAEVAEAGREAYDLDFNVCTWEEAVIESGSYDVVSLWGTDSHFLAPLESFRKISDSLRPGGVFAMNYQAFEHPIRRVFPKLKTGWNVMFNLTDDSFARIMRLCQLEVIDTYMEWQLTSLGHILRAVRANAPIWADRLELPMPAVSLRTVIARKAK